MHEQSVIRIVLCDDHVIVREGLQRMIAATAGFDVVATASDGQEGIEAALRLRPDVVVMDLVMPRLDGAEATRRIMAEAPEINVVVLTSFADNDHVLRAIDAGARGYLLKDAPAHEVIRALRAAAAGGAPLDPRAAGAIVSRQMAYDPRRSLSDREREILSLVADGIPPKTVAQRLGISHQTVRAHLSNIYRQIGVTDRTQAALWATQHGLGTQR